MPTATESTILTFKDWTFHLTMPKEKPKRFLILMHGWMGDENSMGVLARNLATELARLAPRGIYPVPEGGYSWREIRPGTWGQATLEDFRPTAAALVTFVDEWAASAGMELNQFDLMGFSQGAAMTYTLALLYPQRIRQMAALSGFIPEGGQFLSSTPYLQGKKVFVSHGRKDDMVPVEQSRKAVRQLEQAGAVVTYCESDAGHKISKECLKEMEMFFGKP